MNPPNPPRKSQPTPSPASPPAPPEAPTPAPPPTPPEVLIEYRSPVGAQDIRNTIVIKELGVFLITNLDGNVPAGNIDGLGLYYSDTRFLSTYQLNLEGITPVYLLSTGEQRFSQVQELTNPDLVSASGAQVPRQVVRIQRQRVIGPDLWEEISLTNYHVTPLTLELTFDFDADFKDMFEVRGLVVGRSGTFFPPEWHDHTLTFRYRGVDGEERRTEITFDPPPTTRSERRAAYQLTLPAREAGPKLRVCVRIFPGPKSRASDPAVSGLIAARTKTYDAWYKKQVAISTENIAFAEAVRRARFDLRLLTSQHDQQTYPSAGVPWYVALFGRDSLITALEFGWFPEIAASVLRLLAKYQGATVDNWRDEQPGRILHEFRSGQLTRAKLVPYSPYYGTVDATLLFIIALDRYYRTSGDLGLVMELQNALEKALDWMEKYGDLDGDGFIEYQTHSPNGLQNQGWKDSWDAIVNADGSLVEPPTALVEVQGYAYAARLAAARLYRALGNGKQAAQNDYLAEWLRDHFDHAFWMPDKGCYCLALDKKKRQAQVISSNAGQVLWSGIALPERARQVAQRLMQPDMFSGWGIRTLSADEVRFNPMGYHLGTVWPHDNALIARGFKRYGEDEKLDRLSNGLIDVVRTMPDLRLPELICGHDRAADETPVRYPIACSPQAWAAGALESLVQTFLGIQISAPEKTLSVAQPRLPAWLDQLGVSNVPVGKGAVDLSFRRVGDHTFTEIVDVRGDVRVQFTEEWQG